MINKDKEWNNLRKIIANAMKKGLIAWNNEVVILVPYAKVKQSSKSVKASSGKKNKLVSVKTAIGKK